MSSKNKAGKTTPVKNIPGQNAAEKDKALKLALDGIEKQFGKGALMRLGDKPPVQVDVIPTGCMAIDNALGIGGIPRGRIVEIYGPESSGKTTAALHIIAQKQGGTAAFIDAEHALDPAYAAKLGVDIDNLYISQPDTGEQALEITEALVRSSAIDIITVDSVAALVPKAEIDGVMGDSHVGLQARLMSQALRKLAGVVSKSNTSIIFINQLREKVGVSYGSPEVTTGGKALKFYATIRMDVRRGEPIKNGTEIIGNRTRIKIVKNKMAPPFKVAEFDILYGEGISKEGSLLDIAIARNMITRSGSWYSYGDMRIAQGRDNVRKYMKDNPDFYQEIEDKVKEDMNPLPSPEDTSDSDPGKEEEQE